MIDIKFYQNIFALKQKMLNGHFFDKEYLWNQLEASRSLVPVIYNIETTNACNMRCEMCPRTTMMTRAVETMDMITFAKIAAQMKPFSAGEWQTWESFVTNNYGIRPEAMDENHFFLYIIPKVTVLHGYGDPLLDKDMTKRIEILAANGILSYFSCNPANIDIPKSIEMFRSGLSYIKYSIESTDDAIHKKIRGNSSNFSEAYRKIIQLLELKSKLGYQTVVVITMLNLYKPWQEEEFFNLREAFKNCDVYIYLKSQDQQWYQDMKKPVRSLHWTEFCQFPWSSMTIKSNGEAVMCVEDFNNEIIVGDARREGLHEIWNSDRYRKLRQDHLDLAEGIKCTQQCDMKLVGSYLANRTQAVKITGAE